MKKILLVLVCGIVLFSLNSLALDRKAGKVETGKVLFKEKCKSCHNGKSAKKLTHAKKMRSQWKRYLKDNQRKLARKHAAKEVTVKLSEQELNDLWAFVYVGAMDSEKPQTCD
jgi:cytochrome c553